MKILNSLRIFKSLITVLPLCGIMTDLSAQVTADIDVTRTSGVAPLAIYFDAAASTASGVSHPFHNLHYEWNFDDTTAGNWSITGKPKNFATGPATAHVFETPGTYEVLLTVMDANGNSDTDTVTITVTDPDTVYSGTHTICFSTDGDFTGAPSGAQQVTTSSFNTAMGYKGSGKRLLFKRGQTFDNTATHALSVTGPGTIGAFGSGANPVIDCVTDVGKLFSARAPDWRIMDLHANGSGDTMLVEGKEFDNLLVLRTTITPNTIGRAYSCIGSSTSDSSFLPTGTFLVDNVWDQLIGSQAIYIKGRKIVIMGNVLRDLIPTGEHVLRVAHSDQAVISHNLIAGQNGPPNTKGGKELIALRSSDYDDTTTGCPGCGEASREVIVADNILEPSNLRAINMVAAGGSSDVPVRGEDYILERNLVRAYSTMFGSIVGFVITDGTELSVDYYTVRNNIFLMDGWGGNHTAIETTSDNGWIYNNTGYTSDTAGTVRMVRIQSPGIEVRNNLLYAPNVSSPTVIDGSPSVSSNNLLVTTNPFVTSSISNVEDVQLAAGSAPIDAGYSNLAIYRDFFLNPRSPVSTLDVGASEYHDTQAVTFVDLVGAQPDGSEDNLFHSSWFGDFYFQESWNGWIRHQDFQWLYVEHVSDISTMWLWSQDLSAWIYTHSNAFPWLWVARKE